MSEQKKPVSQVVKLVHNRVQESLHALGGLEDKHLKFLTYYIKHELKIANFRFVMDYKSEPKVLTIHCFTEKQGDSEPQEIFVRPKQADILDKIAQYLGLSQWSIQFARRAT